MTHPAGETQEIPAALDRVVEALARDGLVAYPTETFYGLGANATSEKALDRLFDAKQRPRDMPVPVIIGEPGALAPLVTHVSKSAGKLMKAFWPGPLTLLFPAAGGCPARVTGGTGKVGVRVPDHPVAAAIARGCAWPITATSANRSGEREACAAGELDGALREAVDLIISGARTPGGPPSTVLDVTVEPPRLVRPGRIPEAEIRSALEAA